MLHFKSKRHKVIFIIAVLFLCVLGLFVTYNLTKVDPVDYFNNHKEEFNQIAEYLSDNPEIHFDVCNGELDDLEKIDDYEVVNAIQNIMSDGIIFEIRNHNHDASQIKIYFICYNIFVKADETVSIVFSMQTPRPQISYKGDQIEYVFDYEQIDDNWYREFKHF